MARPRKVTPSVEKTICLARDLVLAVDLELYSELEGRIPFGAWQSYIEALIRDDLARRGVRNGQAITRGEFL